MRILYRNHIYEATILNELGIVSLIQKKYSEALDQFQESMELKMKYDLKNINLAKINMAICYKNLMEVAKARILYSEILNAYDEGKCQECNEKVLAQIHEALDTMD